MEYDQIALVVGHANGGITEKVYTHLGQASKAKAMAREKAKERGNNEASAPGSKTAAVPTPRRHATTATSSHTTQRKRNDWRQSLKSLPSDGRDHHLRPAPKPHADSLPKLALAPSGKIAGTPTRLRCPRPRPKARAGARSQRATLDRRQAVGLSAPRQVENTASTHALPQPPRSTARSAETRPSTVLGRPQPSDAKYLMEHECTNITNGGAQQLPNREFHT